MSAQGVIKSLGIWLVGMVFISTLGLGPGTVVGAADEVRIGILSPLTGPAAKFGQLQRNALTMAAEDINNAGGIKSMGGAKSGSSSVIPVARPISA